VNNLATASNWNISDWFRLRSRRWWVDRRIR
jgi:hypothetical protein